MISRTLLPILLSASTALAGIDFDGIASAVDSVVDVDSNGIHASATGSKGGFNLNLGSDCGSFSGVLNDDDVNGEGSLNYGSCTGGKGASATTTSKSSSVTKAAASTSSPKVTGDVTSTIVSTYTTSCSTWTSDGQEYATTWTIWPSAQATGYVQGSWGDSSGGVSGYAGGDNWAVSGGIQWGVSGSGTAKSGSTTYVTEIVTEEECGCTKTKINGSVVSEPTGSADATGTKQSTAESTGDAQMGGMNVGSSDDSEAETSNGSISTSSNATATAGGAGSMESMFDGEASSSHGSWMVSAVVAIVVGVVAL